jgi:hypothetical protein
MDIGEFKEKQKFNQVWLYCILVPIGGLCLWGLADRLIFTDKLDSVDILLLALCIVGLISVALFLITSLETEINKDGVYVQFRPFMIKRRQIPWTDIEDVEVKMFDAMADYGGAGIKYGRNGLGYIISGQFGLEIRTKDDNRILIGTNKREEIARLIKTFKHRISVA